MCLLMVNSSDPKVLALFKYRIIRAPRVSRGNFPLSNSHGSGHITSSDEFCLRRKQTSFIKALLGDLGTLCFLIGFMISLVFYLLKTNMVILYFTAESEGQNVCKKLNKKQKIKFI